MNALWFSDADEAHLRSSIRQQFAQVIPAGEVDLVTDLTVQASRAAIETIERVCSSTNDYRHFTSTVAATVGIVAARCSMIEAAVKDYADKSGAHRSESQIVFGGQR